MHGARARLRFSLLYDFRNPRQSGISFVELYREVLDQVAFADDLGFDTAWLTEQAAHAVFSGGGSLSRVRSRRAGVAEVITWAVPWGMRAGETYPYLERLAKEIIPHFQ